jgi:hypothetical protein
MYFYCYGYVFPLYIYVWLPWLRVFRASSSVVRQMSGKNPQRRGTVSTLPNFCFSMHFLCCSMYCLFCVVLCIVCVCTCALNYCHRVATQFPLNISYHDARKHEYQVYYFLYIKLLWWQKICVPLSLPFRNLNIQGRYQLVSYNEYISATSSSDLCSASVTVTEWRNK